MNNKGTRIVLLVFRAELTLVQWGKQWEGERGGHEHSGAEKHALEVVLDVRNPFTIVNHGAWNIKNSKNVKAIAFLWKLKILLFKLYTYIFNINSYSSFPSVLKLVRATTPQKNLPRFFRPYTNFLLPAQSLEHEYNKCILYMQLAFT